jgi:transcriptional regulator with XRE-family HTH domain
MTSMNISKTLADGAILAEIGARVARRRLEIQMTQADVAEQAGVAKRTVERIEGGASAQMSSIVRILRVLDLLPGLDRMIPEAGPRPMELLKQKGKLRQRASRFRHAARPNKPWSWDGEP